MHACSFSNVPFGETHYLVTLYTVPYGHMMARSIVFTTLNVVDIIIHHVVTTATACTLKVISTFIKPGARLVSRNHFDADVGMCVYVCVCVCVCVRPPGY